MPHILDQLAQRVGLAVGATVVVDRGLASAANIAVIQQRKLHYVVAARQSERDQWLANFDDHRGFTPVLRRPSPTNPVQKKSCVDVQMQRRGDLVYVLDMGPRWGLPRLQVTPGESPEGAVEAMWNWITSINATKAGISRMVEQ